MFRRRYSGIHIVLAVLLATFLAANCERSPTDPLAREMLRKAKDGYYKKNSQELIQPKGVAWSEDLRRTARKIYARHAPELSYSVRRAVEEDRLVKGMSELDVLVMMGYPLTFQRADGSSVSNQKWVYKATGKTKSGGAVEKDLCLFFTNGNLQSWAK